MSLISCVVNLSSFLAIHSSINSISVIARFRFSTTFNLYSLKVLIKSFKSSSLEVITAAAEMWTSCLRSPFVGCNLASKSWRTFCSFVETEMLKNSIDYANLHINGVTVNSIVALKAISITYSCITSSQNLFFFQKNQQLFKKLQEMMHTTFNNF